jgi:TRAP-type C4-dicarboxylate transport system permease large subunit
MWRATQNLFPRWPSGRNSYNLVAGGVSVGKLFLAGYIPGIALGLSLSIVCYFIALRRKYPCEKRPPLKECVKISVDGIFALLAALIIVVGIAAGIFTATEASAVAVMYAAFLGFVIEPISKVC